MGTQVAKIEQLHPGIPPWGLSPLEVKTREYWLICSQWNGRALPLWRSDVSVGFALKALSKMQEELSPRGKLLPRAANLRQSIIIGPTPVKAIHK